MVTPSPSEMTLQGRIGAFALHSKHNPRDTTANARAAFLSGFERKVDPGGVLSPEERARRAEMARKEHFARLSYLSAKARRKRSKRNGADED